MTETPLEISAFTIRTTGITEYNWINFTSAQMDDDTLGSVEKARWENLRDIHDSLAMTPPQPAGLASLWREPYPDMKVTIYETIFKHDLVTGKTIEERPLEKYTLEYRQMKPEEN